MWTTSDAAPPRSSRRLHARMTPRLDDLARRAIAQFTAEVPTYAVLPREELEGEILEIVRHNIRLFLRVLDDGRLPSRDELARIIASAARRAEEGVPLADVLAAYHIGGRLGWEEMIDTSGPGDVDELLAAGLHLLRYMQELTSAVSGAYLEVQGRIHGEERVARQELATALLHGRPLDTLAERAGTTVAPAHVVLTLTMPGIADDQGLGAGTTIATRRRVQLLQAELDQFAGMPVLGVLDAGGGTVLLPATAETVADVDVAVPAVVERLASVVADGAVHAAAVPARTIADIPPAARLAHDLADLARRLGRPSGLYRLDDLLVEYQLTRPGPARDSLARKLLPVAAQPSLLETLRTYMGHDRQRLRTAEALHIHPNTLGYRLSRIAALTGLDPIKHADSQVLAAALTVYDEAATGPADVTAVSGRRAEGSAAAYGP